MDKGFYRRGNAYFQDLDLYPSPMFSPSTMAGMALCQMLSG